MTATSPTYLTAREHIDDLQREALRHRLAAELRGPRRPWLRVLRPRTRRVARAATA
jgi:hypothetical protein